MKVLAVCAKCCENTEKDDFHLSMGAGRAKVGGGRKVCIDEVTVSGILKNEVSRRREDELQRCDFFPFS